MKQLCKKIKILLLALIFITVSCDNEEKTENSDLQNEQENDTSSNTPRNNVPLDVPPVSADDSSLSDEFGDAASISNWLRLWEVERWPHDQLEVFDIGESREGWMTMQPYTSAWFNDYRGILAFKQIQGDFVATSHLEVSNRAGNGPPQRQYSLAGILVREPKEHSAASWQAGQENYIFLSVGTADSPGTYQSEVKTTLNSNSTLEINSFASGVATIRVARIGQVFILLIKAEGGSWQIHRRYNRSDFGSSLQVGLTSYTDWQNVESRSAVEHNSQQITDGEPDLIAQFDYMRYTVPEVPENFSGLDLSDEAAVSNADLLTFLGGE